ncbi:MAG: S-layer homology domain [Phormidesmis priestleyi Ana]|uniref:S-layer homology domain n=1 Tax=Phormidesmis priestleyi Ana TaxID=1666911 RepID=A0A0P7ZY25_9CYAN|nr:MAG: S-layer homology domain [Phormidesmis priestleyi Ana]
MRLNLFSGLLVGLLVVSGCSGSELGNTVSESLEPDPQLLEDTDTTTGTTTGTTAATPPKNPTQGSDSEAIASSTPKGPSSATSNTQTNAVGSGQYTDLNKAPEELQPYLEDLLELDLLTVRPPIAAPPASSPASNNNNSSSNNNNSNAPAKANPPAPNPDEFRPNQAITRREYARWLLATNNRFYAGEPNRRIRLGVTSSAPVFQDVPVSDPDFAAIQGLAEAGIIPSPLTGSSTALTFRPDAPLNREDLLLWKVPLDTRSPLPQATPTAVTEAWGFQDASKIEPRPLQAILADFQNGDFANIRRAFGYTTLFQPDKAATRAEAAAVLWRFGNSTESVTGQALRNPGAAVKESTDQENPGG